MDEHGNRTCEPLQLPSLVKEINTCILSLDKTQTCVYRSEYENVVKQGRYQLISIVNKIKAQNCRKPSFSPKEDIERDIFTAEMEGEFEEAKIAHIRKEWARQQKSMAELQERVYKKNRLLSLHSSYCSSQGSALCSILAVLMDNEDLVESFLAEADIYLVSFVKIANGCLFSFVRSYAIDEPLEDSTDFKYILALYTCISRISDLPSGRQFLLRRPECRVMLSELIYILPYIKQATATSLKVILTKVLHDVTKEEDGVGLLHLCSEVLATLNSCIAQDYDSQFHKYLLEILERITKEMPSQEFLNKLSDLINMQRLNNLSNLKYKDVNEIPRRIFQNIKTAAEEFLKRQQAQGDAPRSPSEDRPRSPPNKRKRASKRRKAPSPQRTKKIQTNRFPHEHTGSCVCGTQKFKSNEDLRTGSSSRLTTSATSSSTLLVTHSKNLPTFPEGRTRPCSRRNSSPVSLTMCRSPYRNMFQISSESTRRGPQRPATGSNTCRSRPHSADERTSSPNKEKQELYKTDDKLVSKSIHKPPCGETFTPQENFSRSPSSSKRSPGSTPKSRERRARSSSETGKPKDSSENEKRPCGAATSAPCEIRQTTCRPSSANEQTSERPSSANKQPRGSLSKVESLKKDFGVSSKIQQTTCRPSSGNVQTGERPSSANKQPRGKISNVDANKKIFSVPYKIRQTIRKPSTGNEQTRERLSSVDKQPWRISHKIDYNKKAFSAPYKIQQTIRRPSSANEKTSNRPTFAYKPPRGNACKVDCIKKAYSPRNASQSQPKTPLSTSVCKPITSSLDFLGSKQNSSSATRPEIELKPTELSSEGSQPGKLGKPGFKYSFKIWNPKRSFLPVPKIYAANKKDQLAKPCCVSAESKSKMKTELTDFTGKGNKGPNKKPQQPKAPMPCSNRPKSPTGKTSTYAPPSSLSRVDTNTSSFVNMVSKSKERTIRSNRPKSPIGKTSTCAPPGPSSHVDSKAFSPANIVSKSKELTPCSNRPKSETRKTSTCAPSAQLSCVDSKPFSSVNISSNSKKRKSSLNRSKLPTCKTSTCAPPAPLLPVDTKGSSSVNVVSRSKERTPSSNRPKSSTGKRSTCLSPGRLSRDDTNVSSPVNIVSKSKERTSSFNRPKPSTDKTSTCAGPDPLSPVDPEASSAVQKVSKLKKRTPSLNRSKLPTCRISTCASPPGPLSRVDAKGSSSVNIVSKSKERTSFINRPKSSTDKTSTCPPPGPLSSVDTNDLSPVNIVPSKNLEEICSCGATSKNMLVPWTPKNDFSSVNNIVSSKNLKEVCSSTCRPTSKNMLVPWTPKNSVVSRLNEFDKQSGPCLRNSVRIISTLENRTSRLRQQRVLTRIKITGAPFKRFLTCRKDDWTST